MTVWVSPRGNARHDVRVKVNMTHGNQMTISNTAVVGVRPTPHAITGQLSSSDEQAVFEWVALNADALVEYGTHWSRGFSKFGDKADAVATSNRRR